MLSAINGGHVLLSAIAIGFNNAGTLNLDSAGTVSCSIATLAVNGNATANAIINGINSRWTNSGEPSSATPCGQR